MNAHAQIASSLGRGEQSVVARLRAENDELRERVRRLQEQLQTPDDIVSPAWKLTASEAAIYRDLARTKAMRTKEQLHFALFGFGENDADIGVVDVFICKIRAKIKRFGGSIETTFGTGYRLCREPVAPQPAALLATGGPWEALAMIDFLVEDTARSPSRVFIAVCRRLAAADGRVVSGKDLCAAVYAGWQMPAQARDIVSKTVGRHRQRVEQYGWQIVTSAGCGGGYLLRKKRAAA